MHCFLSTKLVSDSAVSSFSSTPLKWNSGIINIQLAQNLSNDSSIYNFG